MRRVEGAMLAGALLAGCAAPATAPAPALFRDPSMGLRQAQAAVHPGLDKARVQALLGPAETLRFDSGYEVWAYRDRRPREAGAGAGAELVILFAPSGQVHKVRARPADPPARR